MARPREFDRQDAARSALELFWRGGYDGVCISDLERVTGVDRKGLYNTYGNKEGLFREALDLYLARAETLIQTPLEAPDAGRSEVEAILRMLASPAGHLKHQRGCLLCHSAAEGDAGSAAVARRVRAYFRRLRDGFAHALRGARDAGELGTGRDPEVLADFLVGTVMGLSAMARAGRPRAQIDHYIDTALGALD